MLVQQQQSTSAALLSTSRSFAIKANQFVILLLPILILAQIFTSCQPQPNPPILPYLYRLQQQQQLPSSAAAARTIGQYYGGSSNNNHGNSNGISTFSADTSHQYSPLYGTFYPQQQRSAFAQGIESGFGSLFPRYPASAVSAGLMAPYQSAPFVDAAAAIPPSQHRFMPMPFGGYVSPNNNAMIYGGGGGGWSPQLMSAAQQQYAATNQFLSDSLFDRENFQARGCGWDQARAVCTDMLGICKGGCQDFSREEGALLHDCRCVPVGYSNAATALLLATGKR